MCIICVSKSGVQQPTDTTLRAMFRRNPHGAGYMYARDGKVTMPVCAAMALTSVRRSGAVVMNFIFTPPFHSVCHSSL